MQTACVHTKLFPVPCISIANLWQRRSVNFSPVEGSAALQVLSMFRLDPAKLQYPHCSLLVLLMPSSGAT